MDCGTGHGFAHLCTADGCVLHEAAADHSTEHTSASIGTPSQETCDTMQRPPYTHTHDSVVPSSSLLCMLRFL
jgi:hypothetical protein